MKWLNKTEQLYSYFSPYALFAGVLFSFAGLSIAGRIVSQQNLFESFTRFHTPITPEGLFYPTVSQLRSHVKTNLKPNQVAVIIGGSSVFNGVGQRPSHLWSNRLQTLLGDQYKVFNFAFRGGSILEHGSVTAQSLVKEGYKVIYVADTRPGFIGEPDGNGSTYKYAFWDAYYKGLLEDDGPRDARLKAIADQATEIKLHMRLDSVSYANDLWNTIGYTHLFTVWNSLIAGNHPKANFLAPRRNFPDGDIAYKPEPVETRYQRWDTAKELEIASGMCTAFFDETQNFAPRQDVWQAFQQTLKESMPDTMKQKTLIVVSYRSPYYLNQLPQAKQDCWKQAVNRTVDTLKASQFHAISSGGNFTAADFNDGVHLVESGGDKVADLVAPEVIRIAKQLNYLP